MPMKEWFRRWQPAQLYVVLGLTLTYFVAELFISHITHALTLLTDAYHTLCNIFALCACMITVKYGEQANGDDDEKSSDAPQETQDAVEGAQILGCSDRKLTAPAASPSGAQKENTLKNTFGWARIEVIGMLICCVFLASLCFSILVEAVQTLIHINHLDEMHHPVLVLCLGAVGLLLNGVCYLLIGGYTFHQGSFLYVTESGCIVVDSAVTTDSVRTGKRRLSRTKTRPPLQHKKRQGCREMIRDIVGCVFVIVCAVMVYYSQKDVAKYIDPIMSIISATSLMILSYPYMKESAQILLQTIPDTINIDSLRTQLLQHFPEIINVHDLHIWQLTANKVISTIHIIFESPRVYAEISSTLNEFFLEQGITQVTIQPEFMVSSKSTETLTSSTSQICLMQCLSEGCKESHCCPNSSRWKSLSREGSIQSDSEASDLKQITIDCQRRSLGGTHEEQDIQVCNKDDELHLMKFQKQTSNNGGNVESEIVVVRDNVSDSKL